MRAERLVSVRNPWFTGSVAITAGIALVAAGFGFVWLPTIEKNARFAGLWDAVCSAAGVPRPAPAASPVVPPSVPVTRVVLTPRDMRDLAAYYGYLPRPPHPRPRPAPRIVESGAPMRGIAPCGSCHGAVDHKMGSPWLESEPAAYLLAQLQAFASGARHNDIGEQMRNVARPMTPAEMEAAARYYAGQP